MIGEYGIPDNDPRWLTVLDNFFAALDTAGMDGAYWAAANGGELSALVQPPQISPSTGRRCPRSRPMRRRLSDHAVGRHSLSVARATAGSFVPSTAAASRERYNIMVRFTDTAGAGAFGDLLYVSPVQINVRVPATITPGRATDFGSARRSPVGIRLHPNRRQRACHLHRERSRIRLAPPTSFA